MGKITTPEGEVGVGGGGGGGGGGGYLLVNSYCTSYLIKIPQTVLALGVSELWFRLGSGGNGMSGSGWDPGLVSLHV